MANNSIDALINGAIDSVSKNKKTTDSSSQHNSSRSINDDSLSSTNANLRITQYETPGEGNNQTTIAKRFDNYEPYLRGQQFEAGSGVIVSLEMRDGEYVLKILRKSNDIPSSTGKVEETKQMTQSAGVLFLREEMLRHMGEQLFAQYLPMLQNIFGKFVTRINSRL